MFRQPFAILRELENKAVSAQHSSLKYYTAPIGIFKVSKF